MPCSDKISLIPRKLLFLAFLGTVVHSKTTIFRDLLAPEIEDVTFQRRLTTTNTTDNIFRADIAESNNSIAVLDYVEILSRKGHGSSKKYSRDNNNVPKGGKVHASGGNGKNNPNNAPKSRGHSEDVQKQNVPYAMEGSGKNNPKKAPESHGHGEDMHSGKEKGSGVPDSRDYFGQSGGGKPHHKIKQGAQGDDKGSVAGAKNQIDHSGGHKRQKSSKNKSSKAHCYGHVGSDNEINSSNGYINVGAQGKAENYSGSSTKESMGIKKDVSKKSRVAHGGYSFDKKSSSKTGGGGGGARGHKKLNNKSSKDHGYGFTVQHPVHK